jgi:hypothetical protein
MHSQVAGHVLAFYDELERRANRDDDGNLTFVGNMTEAWNYLGISTSMYSRVRRVLLKTRSIQIVQRGTGAQPSIVTLHGAPSAEDLSNEDLTSPRRLATLLEQLENRVTALEERIPANVLEALREQEERLSEVERVVSDGEKGTT